MEFTNPERKPLSELIKEADEKKMKIVIVGDADAGTIAKARTFIESDHFLVIGAGNLLEEDLKKINEANERTLPVMEVIPFKLERVELPEMIVEDESKVDPKETAKAKVKFKPDHRNLNLPKNNPKKFLRNHRRG